MFEWDQVHLAQGPFVHLGIDRSSLELRIVRNKMFGCGPDTAALNALNKRCCQAAAEDWVFGVALEVATPERAAMQVDGWGEQHVRTLRLTFVSQQLTQPSDQVWVPGSTQHRAGRDTCGGCTRAHLAAATNPAGTVADNHRGDTEPVYSAGRPHSVPHHQPTLLVQGQRGQEVTDTLAHQLRLLTRRKPIRRPTETAAVSRTSWESDESKSVGEKWGSNPTSRAIRVARNAW